MTFETWCNCVFKQEFNLVEDNGAIGRFKNDDVCVKIYNFIHFTGLMPKSFGLGTKSNLCSMCSLQATKMRKAWIMECILSIYLSTNFNKLEEGIIY